MDDKTDGQLAYEGFYDNYQRGPMAAATWESQSDELKAAWEAAGAAVRKFDRPPHH